MKTNSVKMILSVVMIVALSAKVLAQIPQTPVGEEGRLPDQLEKKDVPVIVTDNYYRDYPSSTVESWYVYPEYSYVDGTDWYVYTPSAVRGAPEYYLVEFTSDKTPHKVVYSKTGVRVSTYRELNTGLPKAVTNALKKSPYKHWTVVKEKEEIRRDSDAQKVYKIVVEKEGEKHTLYYQEDGKLLKDKTEKPK